MVPKLVKNPTKGARTYLPSKFITLFNKANEARDDKQYLSAANGTIIIGAWDDDYEFTIN